MSQGNVKINLKPACRDCKRVFDLLDPVDSEEWAYGHDCES